MRTLGVDLASLPKRTAACTIRWQAGRASVERLLLGVDDERLLVLADEVTKVGIDVPFGWPDAFAKVIAAHHEGGALPQAELRDLRFRRTDLYVWERTGKPPLSVSTDKIGVPALRAARLLARWDAARTGEGKFVEVYPRAARNAFRLSGTRSVEELRGRSPWLDLDAEHVAQLERSEDLFDALIASLVGRCSALGLCEVLPDDAREVAEREGWIALPLAGSLEQLAS